MSQNHSFRQTRYNCYNVVLLQLPQSMTTLYSQGTRKAIVPRPLKVTHPQLDGLDPILQTIFATRGIRSLDELDRNLAKLPSPWKLSGMEFMVEHLLVLLQQQQRIMIVGDFDADGATSCATALKGLQLLGFKQVDFIVPNRFEYGYGLTPEIVELAAKQQPAAIITVDNGISSIEGVASAQALGIKVLITDHHLPGTELPAADAIVNPNLADDSFPSRNLAGVGVIFYVLLALRARLREQNWFLRQELPEPNLAQLLDYVALGTVADVVPLDWVNRILVHQGLLRIRSGQCHVGIKALVQQSGRSNNTLSATDLGFALGPRLNAAGRMDDMSLGIKCLITDDAQQAHQLAQQLDELNKERRDIEAQMKQEALNLLNGVGALDKPHLQAGVCIFDKSWHQGVIGILASRIKDKLHRPVIAFAPAGAGEIKGSARSIPGVHIRDVLSDIASSQPKLLSKFGGHALAAGLSLKMHDYPAFALQFDIHVKERLANVDLEQKIYSDGQLAERYFNVEFAQRLADAATWGQAFPEPVFSDVFEVVQARVVGQQHLKLVLRKAGGGSPIDAIAFFVDKVEYWLGVRKILTAYKLDINEFRGQCSVQLLLHYLEKLS